MNSSVYVREKSETQHKHNCIKIDDKEFSFTHVWERGASLASILNVLQIDTSRKGGIIMYGMTGSGKTYTMDGIVDFVINNSDISKEKPLILSGVEIYMDKIEIIIAERTIDNRASLKSAILSFRKSRATGATKMNEKSSRSHAILRIGEMYFVDLAGSESQKRTESEGKRLKEGSATNNGLLTLGRIIRLLAENKRNFIPYRENPLTLMLKDILPYSKIIITIDSTYKEETIASLRFGCDAKLIDFDKQEEKQPILWEKLVFDIIEEKDKIIEDLEKTLKQLMEIDSD